MSDAFMDPIRVAVARYLAGYFSELVPMTAGVQSFMQRPLETAIAFAPGRLVDDVEGMITKWMRANDSPGSPAIIVGIAQDWTPTSAANGRQQTSKTYARISDDDPRITCYRTIAADFRLQVVIFGHQSSDVKSLAAQLALFIDRPGNRRFYAEHLALGTPTKWSVILESPEVIFGSVASNARNMHILALDLTVRTSIPVFYPADKSVSADGSYPSAVLINSEGNFND